MTESPHAHDAGDLPEDARIALAAGRLWATRAAPYLAHAILALRPVIRTRDLPDGSDLNAFPVDQGWNLYVDPAVLAATPPAEIGFWHVHHATHLLRRHAARSPIHDQTAAPTRSRTQRWWNEASDAETNDDLVPGLATMQLDVPTRALLPSHLGQPDGQLAEAYFRRQQEKDVRPPAPAADCGSGVDGVCRPWDCGDAALSGLEHKLLAGDVARRIRDGGIEAGNEAGGWKRWADQILDPVVEWRRQLAASVRRGRTMASGRTDYSYSRPSRRASTTPDVIQPILRRPVPVVAVVVDTSGSMTGDPLSRALSEVSGLLAAGGISARRDGIRLISCDTQAFDAQRVLNVRDVHLTGGGGTDMGAGLQAAAELKPLPDIVIVLTDGHTPWPARSPGPFTTIVAVLDQSGSSPPWATRIDVGVGEPAP